jgi:galactonate dehydratase
MKITGVKAIFADGGRSVFVFVKKETDQPGLVGRGVASLEGKPRAEAGYIADMEPMVLGEGSRRIEYILQVLTRGAFWRQGIIGCLLSPGSIRLSWLLKVKKSVNRCTNYGGAPYGLKPASIPILAVKRQTKQ